MADKISISNKYIINLLNNNYNFQVTSITELQLGADAEARVYKAKTKDQQSYFIKIKRNHDDKSVIIPTLLRDANIMQVIAPLKTKDNQTITKLNGLTLVVYPFIEGKNGFNHDLSKDQWITLGKTLRQIHEFTPPTLVKNEIKRESYTPKWREKVKSIYTYIDSRPFITEPIALKLLTYMQQHRQTIFHIIEQANQLAEKIQKKSPKFVLCHSDIHAGNILIANNDMLYIIDWDQPTLAPKERDLMFIGGGIAHRWNNQQEVEQFYKGYGLIEIDREILTYYRYERIIQDIAEYGQELLLTIDDNNNRTSMLKHFLDMFEPCGVIDIALKTDQ